VFVGVIQRVFSPSPNLSSVQDISEPFSKESECRNQQEQPQQAANRGVRGAKDDRDHHKTITCDHRADAVSDKFVGVLASPSDQCFKAITALATVPLGF